MLGTADVQVERLFVTSLQRALEEHAPEELEVFARWFDPSARRARFHVATVIGAVACGGSPGATGSPCIEVGTTAAGATDSPCTGGGTITAGATGSPCTGGGTATAGA